jgi:hypothetical protein
MLSTNITLDQIIPDTVDGRLIWIDQAVEPLDLTPEVSHYMETCRRVISGPGWFCPKYPDHWPNPFNMKVWYDNTLTNEPLNDFTDKTFDEITDDRAVDLMDYFKEDLPIVISYSGGIDSALILSSFIRTWPKEMIDRLVIKMNNSSYFESPKMFHDVIVKNNIKYTDQPIYDWENSYLLAGEPGDAVWITSTLIEMSVVYDNPHKLSVYKNAKKLLDWLSFLSTPETAHWFYHTNIENAKSHGFDISTYEDFFWWAKTNLAMGANRLNLINHIVNPWHEGSFDLFLNRAIPFYHTREYRAWSKTNRNNDVKFNGKVESYKMPAKKYINTVLKDPYYERYKTKINSAYNKSKRVIALFNDGTLILDKNYWTRQRL